MSKELGYRFWYPGYYIHSCPKMKYKIDYSPQYVLDPEALSWVLLDREMLDLLDRFPYVSRSATREGSASITGLDGADKSPRPDAKPEESGSEPDYASFLFNTGMPGIPSLGDMQNVDMDHIALRVDDSGALYETSDLVVWQMQTVSDYGRIKASVAELVAAVGPDLMGQFCLDYQDHRSS
jgi:arginine-tRNA-protein transferase